MRAFITKELVSFCDWSMADRKCTPCFTASNIISEELKNISLDGAKAALSVCKFVQQKFGVTLLMQVIVERDCVLEMELAMGKREPNLIQQDYEREFSPV